MKILRITTAALAAATAIGVSGAALAGPATNLSTGEQAAQRDDKGAVQQVYHRHYYGYYYSPYYYRPYYRPYGYYYDPYYYGGPSFNFGIHIR
jgi:hypothetical protein